MDNGGNYPTNYDIQGFATKVGPIPTARNKGNPIQQRFADPAAVYAAFDYSLPGDSGTRAPMRGDGYFEEDAGLGKTLAATERFKLKLGMEMFNVTNSVRFAAHSISANMDNAASFGNANSELTNPRLAQFYGRIEF